MLIWLFMFVGSFLLLGLCYGNMGNEFVWFWLAKLFLSFMLSILLYLFFLFFTIPFLRCNIDTKVKNMEMEMEEMEGGIYLARNIYKNGYFFITKGGKRIEVLGENKIIVCASGLSKPKVEITYSEFEGWWVSMVFLIKPCFKEHRIFLLKATQIQNPDIEYW